MRIHTSLKLTKTESEEKIISISSFAVISRFLQFKLHKNFTGEVQQDERYYRGIYIFINDSDSLRQ